MKVTTLRIPEPLYDDLKDEAEERDRSVSEYVREILRDRANTQENTQANTPANTDLAERVDELEARLEAVENTVATDAADSTETPSESEDVARTTPSNSGRDGTTAPATSDAGATPAVADVVESVAEGWSDSDERLAPRKAAAEAVLQHALDTGDAIGKSDAIESFFEEFPVDGQTGETWWRKNIRPVLQEVGEYSNGAHGYVVADLSR